VTIDEPRAPRSVVVVLFDHFELLDVFGPLELFGALPDRFEILLLGEKAGPVRSAQEPIVAADHSYQHIPWVHPKRPPSKLSATREVSKDGVGAPVAAGNGIATRHVPGDVLCQQGSDGVRVPADVESTLGSVEPVQDLHCPSSIHAAHPDANL
jgi:hypothetical protein